MLVKEIMTESPACCTPETSLKDVARMMVDNDCGCIPVVENSSTKKNGKPMETAVDFPLFTS